MCKLKILEFFLLQYGSIIAVIPLPLSITRLIILYHYQKSFFFQKIITSGEGGLNRLAFNSQEPIIVVGDTTGKGVRIDFSGPLIG